MPAFVVFAFCAVGLAAVAGYLWFGGSARDEEAAWAAEGWSMAAFAAKHPRQPNNDKALDLDVLTRPLGLEGAPIVGGRPRLDTRGNVELKGVADYLRDVLKTTDDTSGPARPAVDAFLDRHASALSDIESLLLGPGDVEWARDLDRGPEAPTPNLLGIRRLQEVLLVRALRAADDGRPEAAARSLEAAWRHGASVRHRPELISQLIALSIAHAQTGVLRRVHEPPDWTERLAEVALKDRVLRSYQGEAYSWTVTARRRIGVADLGPPKRRDGLGDRIVRVTTAPYVRRSFLDLSARIRTAMVELRDHDLCTFDAAALDKKITGDMPRWNTIGKIAMPSLFRTWQTLRETAIDAELTRRVIDARRVRRATLTWPTASVPSQVCPGVEWRHVPQADGRLLIEWSANKAGTKSWSFLLSAAPRPRPTASPRAPSR